MGGLLASQLAGEARGDPGEPAPAAGELSNTPAARLSPPKSQATGRATLGTAE
jgi:hypothetical protein